MKDSKNCPIVGYSEYGVLGLVVELGRRLFLCLPHIELKDVEEDKCVFFCQQNDCLSPLEIFMILMWNMEQAILGGFDSNVEDSINFLKRNGITMRPGKIALALDISKDNHGQYSLYTYDDRDIQLTRIGSLEDMADALYNVLNMMSREFGEEIGVEISLNGEDSQELAWMLNCLHSENEEFNMEIL
jgi:hypothetical protein